MNFKRHFCFANISATKARIFLKFDTYIHKIVTKYHNIFFKDPCKQACTRGVNVRARVLPRQNGCTHVFASCTRVCARIFTKNFMIFLYYLMNLSLKFHKDPSFRCGDICKTIMTLSSRVKITRCFGYFSKDFFSKMYFQISKKRPLETFQIFLRMFAKHFGITTISSDPLTHSKRPVL